MIINREKESQIGPPFLSAYFTFEKERKIIG